MKIFANLNREETWVSLVNRRKWQGIAISASNLEKKDIGYDRGKQFIGFSRLLCRWLARRQLPNVILASNTNSIVDCWQWNRFCVWKKELDWGNNLLIMTKMPAVHLLNSIITDALSSSWIFNENTLAWQWSLTVVMMLEHFKTHLVDYFYKGKISRDCLF